jgi:o-succinylbenzoate synthase
LLVIGETDTGLRGVGEIAPWPPPDESSLRQLAQMAQELSVRIKLSAVPTDLHVIDRLLVAENDDRPLLPAIAFGFETMLAELAAKQSGVSLSRWLSKDVTTAVPVNCLIAGGSAAQVGESARRKLEAGFRSFKLKIGGSSVEEDAARISALRGAVDGDAAIRLDANRSLSFEQAVTLLQQVAPAEIEYIEEPLRVEDLDRLSDFVMETHVSLALDESLSDSELAVNLLAAGVPEVMVIKPTFLGGLLRSLEVIKLGRQFGARLVITTSLESGIGVAACLHLAASLGDGLMPCGLDTLGLLNDTLIAEDLPIVGGLMEVPTAPGLGVNPQLTRY